LVSYYQKLEFVSVSPGKSHEEPEDVFKEKMGDGWDFSLFAEHCLIRGGYDVRQLGVPVSDQKTHWTTLYKSDGGWYLLDNAFDADVIFGIQGPFHRVEDATDIYK
jgi:hypothetical protein